MVLKTLIPVDGSANSERAVRHVIERARHGEPGTVVLLNVQPEVDALEVRSHVPAEDICKWQMTRGREALEAAENLLAQAGITCLPRIVVGEPAPTIARLAREEGCDQIVMGTRGMAAIQNLLLGSVATKVIHLAEVPVTLVK